MAVANNHREAIQLLLGVPNIDVNIGTPLPLASAAKHSKELVMLMLDRGADLCRADEEGWTALHEACRSNNIDMVKLLLSIAKESSPSEFIHYRTDHISGQQVPTGQTPISVAAGSGYLDIVKVLLEHGADPNEGGPLSAFHTPLDGKQFPEVLEFLLPLANDRTMNGDDMMPPLLYASVRSDSPAHLRVIKELVGRGADVNCLGVGYRRSPVLFAACWKGLDGVAEILIENGAHLEHDYFGEECFKYIKNKGSTRLLRIAKAKLNLEI